MTNGTTAGTAIDPYEERILATAAARPELTAAEIAEQTGHIVPTVRDTLEAHGDSIDAREDQPAASSKPIDSASFNATERAVLEAALREPHSTNREIATRVNTHVGLVRDIREEYEAVATLPDHESTDAAAGESAMEFDQELLSSAQEEILTLAREEPTLTNAEIADQTGSRLPLVRDTTAPGERHDGAQVARNQPIRRRSTRPNRLSSKQHCGTQRQPTRRSPPASTPTSD